MRKHQNGNIIDDTGKIIKKNIPGIYMDSPTRSSDIKDSNHQALRYDDDKPLMHLLPVAPLLEIARVFTQGALKYAPRNWEKGMDWSRCYNSLLRHLLAWQSGEDIDNESGISHMAHIATNAMFLLEYSKTHPEFDDRPKKVK